MGVFARDPAFLTCPCGPKLLGWGHATFPDGYVGNPVEKGQSLWACGTESSCLCRWIYSADFVPILSSYDLLLIFGHDAALGPHLILFKAGLAWGKTLEKEKPQSD